MNDIEALSAESAEAYAARDFERALLLMDEVIDQSPESPQGLGTRHLRALAYELGNVPGGVDLQKAIIDYRFLADRASIVGSVGFIGCARVLCTSDLKSNVAEIRDLCERAIEVDGSPAARMLLGYVANELGDQRQARKWFWSAFRRGSPWGIRYFAASHWNDGSYVRGFLFHVISAIMWPLMSRPGSGESPYH
jgi:hypothetical protein